ncbi:NAD-dependent epimerase/dehydratase family protein [Candidatus Magnetomoraceae bacterium gMMP-15]
MTAFLGGIVICITGSTGFIGRHIVKHLMRQGVKVKALLRSDSNSFEECNEPDIIKGDIREKKVVKALVKDCNCLIHLAGVYQNRVNSINEMEIINVEATKNLFQIAVESDVKRIIYISSAGVHKHLNGIIDESTPLRINSDDPYEKQKITCEQILNSLSDKYGVETVILRPATVYGPDDTRLLPLFNLIKSRRFFFIGKGANYVSWVYIQDLVNAIEAAVKHPTAPGQAYIITGPDDGLILRDLVSIIAELEGVKQPCLSLPILPFSFAAFICERLCPIIAMPAPINKARLRFFTDSLRYSSKKAKKELNISLNTSIKTGLKLTLKNQ